MTMYADRLLLLSYKWPPIHKHNNEVQPLSGCSRFIRMYRPYKGDKYLHIIMCEL